MSRPLSDLDVHHLLRDLLTPAPAPHPLAAGELLPPSRDLEIVAMQERIFAAVQTRPHPQRLRPLLLTRAGFLRLRLMYASPSRVSPWGAWQSDLNQIARRPIPGGCPLPASWYLRLGLAVGVEYTPDFWHGQWVPCWGGHHHGYYIAWRRILPWPSSTGREPVTLDDLAELVAASRRLPAPTPQEGATP